VKIKSDKYTPQIQSVKINIGRAVLHPHYSPPKMSFHDINYNSAESEDSCDERIDCNAGSESKLDASRDTVPNSNATSLIVTPSPRHDIRRNVIRRLARSSIIDDDKGVLRNAIASVPDSRLFDDRIAYRINQQRQYKSSCDLLRYEVDVTNESLTPLSSSAIVIEGRRFSDISDDLRATPTRQLINEELATCHGREV
jgi:hypothetical protein